MGERQRWPAYPDGSHMLRERRKVAATSTRSGSQEPSSSDVVTDRDADRRNAASSYTRDLSQELANLAKVTLIERTGV